MTQPQWPMPGTTTKTDGSSRHVGVEFELQGISVGTLARLTALTLGGQSEAISAVEYSIQVPDRGEYRVEVDYELLKQIAKDQQELHDDDQRKTGAIVG